MKSLKEMFNIKLLLTVFLFSLGILSCSEEDLLNDLTSIEEVDSESVALDGLDSRAKKGKKKKGKGKKGKGKKGKGKKGKGKKGKGKKKPATTKAVPPKPHGVVVHSVAPTSIAIRSNPSWLGDNFTRSVLSVGASFAAHVIERHIYSSDFEMVSSMNATPDRAARNFVSGWITTGVGVPTIEDLSTMLSYLSFAAFEDYQAEIAEGTKVVRRKGKKIKRGAIAVDIKLPFDTASIRAKMLKGALQKHRNSAESPIITSDAEAMSDYVRLVFRRMGTRDAELNDDKYGSYFLLTAFPLSWDALENQGYKLKPDGRSVPVSTRR